MPPRKIYHHYYKWEDFQAGMWRKVPDHEEKTYLDLAVKFTGDAELYGKWMLDVVKQWPIACEENFTKSSVNHQAWIGHAACCMATGCPEYITRLAWGMLTQKQRDEANKMADRAILKWKTLLKHKNQVNLFE